MAFSVDQPLNAQSSPKTHKLYFLTLTILRVLAIVATLSAASLMFSSKQSTVVYGFHVDARYSYDPSFKFFAYANIVACALSVVALVLTFVVGKKTAAAAADKFYFFLFIHDLIMTVLLIAGFAAGTAVGYVGKYGNSHTGWLAICDHFGKFCNRTMAALILGFLGFLVYLVITVVSAKKSIHF